MKKVLQIRDFQEINTKKQHNIVSLVSYNWVFANSEDFLRIKTTGFFPFKKSKSEITLKKFEKIS